MPSDRPGPLRLARGYARGARRRGTVALARRVPPRAGRRPVPPATLIGVYRAGNAWMVADLLRGVRGLPVDVALWALDEVHPALAAVTFGSGPGGRFDLLDELLARRPPPPDHHVVVADDDVVLRPGIGPLLATAAAAGFGLSMPAHGPHSFHSHRLTRGRPLARARLTTYVEIGPVLVVAPAWRSRVLPFPTGEGLGWGIELEWMALQAEGCRLGVVDAVRVLHTVPPGTTYDTEAEMARLRDRIVRLGLGAGDDLRADMDRLLRDLGVWPRWRSRPGWATGG